MNLYDFLIKSENYKFLIETYNIDIIFLVFILVSSILYVISLISNITQQHFPEKNHRKTSKSIIYSIFVTIILNLLLAYSYYTILISLPLNNTRKEDLENIFLLLLLFIFLITSFIASIIYLTYSSLLNHDLIKIKDNEKKIASQRKNIENQYFNTLSELHNNKINGTEERYCYKKEFLKYNFKKDIKVLKKENISHLRITNVFRILLIIVLLILLFINAIIINEIPEILIYNSPETLLTIAFFLIIQISILKVMKIFD
ncbi:hypothetical protein [Salinicoccus sp. HZC-1]|uniref:hypothetical protein n=1 Tax=Salinicoccus sp. HZC-1 TaxID=3385497 RepID=UPI00398B7531